MTYATKWLGRAALAWTIAAVTGAGAAYAAPGELTQLPGTQGCASVDGSGGLCAQATNLQLNEGVAVSPDSKNVYSGFFAIFDRSLVSGALLQKGGTAGCIGGEGCAPGVAGGDSVVVSADGRNVYTVSRIRGIAILDRDPATGDVLQKPGSAGCVNDSGANGCTDANELAFPMSGALSPDGRSFYVATATSDGVAIFDRDPTTGELTQKPGVAGCITDTGSAGACALGRGLDRADAVTVSPDGENVYVAALFDRTVSVFDRDPVTGALAQKPGAAGCVSEMGADGCALGAALGQATSVEVSPDGRNVYVAAAASAAVAIFDRDPLTGAIVQKAGAAGCVSETGSAGSPFGGSCADGAALAGASQVVVSPDGANAYVASFSGDAVVVMDRAPATGELAQRPGAAGCISDDGSSGCVDGAALDGPRSLAISPDGASVYVTSYDNAALAVFARQTAEGGPGEEPGGPAGGGGAPPDGSKPRPATPGTGAADALRVGATKARTATGELAVTVWPFGPGLLGFSARTPPPAKSKRKPKLAARAKQIVVARATKRVRKAGPVTVVLRPTKAAKRILRAKGRLKARLRIVFTPTSGSAVVETSRVVFKLNRARR